MTSIVRHGIIIAAYTTFVLVMSWPVAGHLTDRVVGSGGDPWQTMWRFEEKSRLVQEAWKGPEPLAYAEATAGRRGVRGASQFLLSEFLGGGEPRLVNLSVWPWMPVHAVFGEPVAYNVVWLLSFVFSGYGMYLLTNHLLSKHSEFSNHKSQFSNRSAFLAGAYYMLLPYHVAHSFGHFGAMQLAWLPFIMVTTLSYIQAPRIWKSVLLGLFLVIQAWTEHHYFLWLMVFTILAGIYYRKELISFVKEEIKNWKFKNRDLKNRTTHSKSRILFSSLCFLFFTLLIVVSYVPTIRLAMSEDTPLNLGREQLIRFSADPLAYIVPASFHPIWRSLVEAMSAQTAFKAVGFTGNVSEGTHYLGVSILLLITFFHQRIPRRQKIFWVTVAGVFFGISLGPLLHIFGYVTSLHLPFDLVDTWPVISSVRAVARASVLVAISVSVLLAFVLWKNLHRPSSAIAMLALMAAEFLFWPVPTQSTILPPLYAHLNELPGRAIVEIPAATNYTIASRALFASQAHGKEVLGNIALERAHHEEEVAMIKSIPALRQLLYLRTTELREGRVEFFDQELTETLPEVSRWFDIPAIIVHADSLSSLQRRAVQNFLEADMNLEKQQNEDLLFYDTTSYLKDLPSTSDGVFLRRESGWEHVGYDPERQAVFAEIPAEATAVFVNVHSIPKQVEITFMLAPESRGEGQLWLNGREVRLITPDGTPLKTALDLLPGENTVQFKTTTVEKIIIQNPSFRVVERESY